MANKPKGGPYGQAYYSTVFSQSADAIWDVIRDFNSYPVWVGGTGESRIEAGKSGDAVGAVRNVVYNGNIIRQRLCALSDLDRTMSYAFCDEAALPGAAISSDVAADPDNRWRRRIRRMVGNLRLCAKAP